MYYDVTVQITTETDKGTPKKKNELYLVDAMSVTEAEARVVKLFEGFTMDFEVKQIKISKVVEVVTPDTKELAIRLAKKEKPADEGAEGEEYEEVEAL